MDDLDRMSYMGNEHYAWMCVVAEFKALGININDEKYTSLVKQIENWGEWLATLRRTQSPELVDEVLKEKSKLADETMTQEARDSLASKGYKLP